MEKENPPRNPQQVPAPIVMRDDSIISDSCDRTLMGMGGAIFGVNSLGWIYRVTYPVFRDCLTDPNKDVGFWEIVALNCAVIPPLCCSLLTYLSTKGALGHKKYN